MAGVIEWLPSHFFRERDWELLLYSSGRYILWIILYIYLILHIQKLQINVTHNTRSKYTIRELYSIQLYRESFLPSIYVQQGFGENYLMKYKTTPLQEIKKKYRNCNNLKILYYYNYESRIGQILQAQLRLEFSFYNFCLFCRNLCHSPFCNSDKWKVLNIILYIV